MQRHQIGRRFNNHFPRRAAPCVPPGKLGEAQAAIVVEVGLNECLLGCRDSKLIGTDIDIGLRLW